MINENKILQKNINMFWESFLTNSKELYEKIEFNDNTRVLNIVNKIIQDSNFDFAFDITQENEHAVLILSPEGDHKIANVIDSILENKPEISNWKFYGRRQKKDLEDAYVIVEHIFGVNIEDSKFEIIPDGIYYDVIMYSDIVEEFDEDESTDLIETFLYHAIGESVFMDKIKNIFACPMNKNGKYITAKELVSTILE